MIPFFQRFFLSLLSLFTFLPIFCVEYQDRESSIFSSEEDYYNYIKHLKSDDVKSKRFGIYKTKTLPNGNYLKFAWIDFCFDKSGYHSYGASSIVFLAVGYLSSNDIYANWVKNNGLKRGSVVCVFEEVDAKEIAGYMNHELAGYLRVDGKSNEITDFILPEGPKVTLYKENLTNPNKVEKQRTITPKPVSQKQSEKKSSAVKTTPDQSGPSSSQKSTIPSSTPTKRKKESIDAIPDQSGIKSSEKTTSPSSTPSKRKKESIDALPEKSGTKSFEKNSSPSSNPTKRKKESIDAIPDQSGPSSSQKSSTPTKRKKGSIDD